MTAGVVTNILRKSFSGGVVPSQWITVIIRPVPKKTSPTNLSDYRPIRVTSIMSRLDEKILVQKRLKPVLSMDLLNDQFAFRPTGALY